MGANDHKEKEMKTIEHKGKTYEVLTLGRISEITHAKLAGGKAVDAESDDYCVITQSPCDYSETRFGFDELEDFGIVPLRLVPKEPVTFEGITHGYQTSSRDGFDLLITVSQDEVNRLSELGVTLNKRFRCVEIVEEA